MLIVQVSDIHLDTSPTSRDRLETVADYLAAMRPAPDLILLTGDLVQTSAMDAAAGYARVIGSMPGGIPMVAVPGNSDDRCPFRQAFAPDAAGSADPAGPVNSSREIGDVAVIGLDSSGPGPVHGELGPETLEWLRAALDQAPNGHTVLLTLHHPPVELGHPMIDQLRLRDPASLDAIVRTHPNVVAVVVGHAHGPASTMFGGRPLIVGPGVRSGLRLSWESPVESTIDPPSPLDETVPPAIAIHRLDGDRLTTWFRTIGN